VQALREVRASLYVPLLRDNECIGVLALTRKAPGAFSDSELALASSFADQAVIAIENVRLWNETKEALDQQRASGEVLAAISSSIDDTAPVFEAHPRELRESLRGASPASVSSATTGCSIFAPITGPIATGSSACSRCRSTKQAGRDWHHDELHRPLPGRRNRRRFRKQRVSACRAVGYRGVIFAPMLWKDRGIGVIFVGRDFTRSFRDKDIALLRTLRRPGGVAIQNARLFNETETALERQTATADVLRAISESPSDTAPVFDAILDKATELCEAETASCSASTASAWRRLRGAFLYAALSALFDKPFVPVRRPGLRARSRARPCAHHRSAGRRRVQGRRPACASRSSTPAACAPGSVCRCSRTAS
jgi:GAF domain-containing protein